MKLKLILSFLFVLNFAVGAALATKPVDQNPNVVLLTENNHVLLRGPVTDASVGQVTAEFVDLLDKRGNQPYPLYLVLDTPGGSVDAGFRLYEFLRTYHNVQTITMGSYSMGAVLVELLSGDRLMVETGTLMFHRIMVGFPRPHGLDQLNAELKIIAAHEKLVMDKIAERTGIDRQQLHKEIDENIYLDAKTALERKFIDRIVQIKCSKSLLAAKKTETVSGGGLFPDLEVERSACPLL